MQRRNFLKWLMAISGGATLAGACNRKHTIPGSILGANASVGHLLRDNNSWNPPDTFEDFEVLILGGGISGLSAAMHLKSYGINNVLLLELENTVGGNAVSGGNEYSKYPYGAHYIPIPNNELIEYMAFLEQANVITGYKNGLPVYNELYLCHAPEYRLYINGKWQDGIVPDFGIQPEDQQQITSFFKIVAKYRREKGHDGKDAFSIPVDTSSQDAQYVQLDSITFKEWLNNHKLSSQPLLWYLNYCTLDDFGTSIDSISAWAGIHYFACRKGKASNAHYEDVLTWEEGNGFLVAHLIAQINATIRTNSLVIDVTLLGDGGLQVSYWDIQKKQIKGIRCKQCIVATPQFINSIILKSVDDTRRADAQRFIEYSAWMVANLKIKSGLEERKGVPMSWDNIIYNGNGLGYVDATHQQIALSNPGKNLTYYKPLLANSNKEARTTALQKTHEQWVDEIITDLKKVHYNIEEQLQQVDVSLWGHAMVQPLPNWIWGSARTRFQKSIDGRLHFAHTDIAGISIFEEAFYQGLNAAKKVKINMNI